MTSLLEDPMPALVAGTLAAVVLGVALVRTGRGIYLLALAGVILATLGFVGLEWLVVTQIEHIEATVEAGAAALESNDLPRTLSFCAPDAHAPRRAAQWALAHARFTQVKITDLRVSINRLTSPPTATAEVTALISAGGRSGQFDELSRPVSLRLFLRSQGDRWLVTGYEDVQPPQF